MKKLKTLFKQIQEKKVFISLENEKRNAVRRKADNQFKKATKEAKRRLDSLTEQLESLLK
jgi:hypothetical protein